MKQVKSIFSDPKIRHGILVTILALFIIRLFYVVPTPGINTVYFQSVVENNGALGFLDVFTGNGLSTMSIMMLNITPYITASIILQLLGNVITRIHEMQHGMRDEQKKIEKVTVILGICLAFVESIALSIGYGRQNLFINYNWYWVLIIACIWTAGSALASIVGKMLQDKYQINGVSLILLLNILAGYPSAATSLYNRFVVGRPALQMGISLVAIIVIVMIFFVFTYYVQETELPVKVNYASKGSIIPFLKNGELPLKLCPGSVVPVIFASSLMTTPVLIASAFTEGEQLWMKVLSPGCWFITDDWFPTIGVAIYLALIIGFSYYYSNTTMNPKEIAENLNKGGAVIPGIRPGADTEKYLKKKSNKVILIGAVSLCIIALVPIVISGIFQLSKLSFLGTSVIIIVGVMLEMKRFLQAQVKHGQYTVQTFEGGLF